MKCKPQWLAGGCLILSQRYEGGSGAPAGLSLGTGLDQLSRPSNRLGASHFLRHKQVVRYDIRVQYAQQERTDLFVPPHLQEESPSCPRPVRKCHMTQVRKDAK
ncbi:hypothetical protein ALP90_200052 [Pseudomonas amygdali pv. ulmi]|uniref:Uncharacterized protein n=1 Tax=Pseudomonas amygdali pv. ulmi TaxID=251720 RepID=A0A3M4S7W4_PSEA0|nr:hypothetical protein ALP90_200052 [Pseudomonas amygdali pv. ulmi]